MGDNLLASADIAKRCLTPCPVRGLYAKTRVLLITKIFISYAINATLASLWILILPDNRRAAISLYVARLAAQCAWEAWKLEGGYTIPYVPIPNLFPLHQEFVLSLTLHIFAGTANVSCLQCLGVNSPEFRSKARKLAGRPGIF